MSVDMRTQDTNSVAIGLLDGVPSSIKYVSNFMPWALTFSAGMGALLFGYHVAFSSPAENAVLRDVFSGNKEQAALGWSLLNIGAIFGSITAGIIASTYGRRFAVLFNAVPYTIGVALMYSSSNFHPMFFTAGRFLAGVGVGYSSVIVPLYIAEIAPSNLRGLLGCVNQLNIASGVLIVSIAGIPIVHNDLWWRQMLLFSMIFVTLQFVPILFWGVESPSWLCLRGQQADARKCLQKLRGSQADITEEIDSLIFHQERNTQANSEPASIFSLFAAGYRTPFLIGVGLMGLQQWSGINGVTFNMKTLFDDGSNSNEYTSLIGTILVNGVQVVATLFACSVMEHVGRRTFMLVSCLGMALSSITMSGAVFFSFSPWVKIASLCAYIMAFAFGMGPLPWILCSEIYPSKIRSTAIAASSIMNWSCSFLVTLLFDDMSLRLGVHGLFLFYAAVCLGGAIFVALCIPETRGLSLVDIEDLWGIQE